MPSKTTKKQTVSKAKASETAQPKKKVRKVKPAPKPVKVEDEVKLAEGEELVGKEGRVTVVRKKLTPEQREAALRKATAKVGAVLKPKAEAPKQKPTTAKPRKDDVPRGGPTKPTTTKKPIKQAMKEAAEKAAEADKAAKPARNGSNRFDLTLSRSPSIRRVRTAKGRFDILVEGKRHATITNVGYFKWEMKIGGKDAGTYTTGTKATKKYMALRKEALAAKAAAQ